MLDYDLIEKFKYKLANPAHTGANLDQKH